MPPNTLTFPNPPPELRASYGSLRDGALPLRKVEAQGAAVLLWTTEPSPLRAGAKGKLLYNSRAGPLGWLDPAQGHAPPRLTYGFNNWRAAPEPVDMVPSTAMPVRRGALRLGAYAS